MSDRFGNISISGNEQQEAGTSPPNKKPQRVKKKPSSIVSKKKSSGKWLIFSIVPFLLFGIYCGVGFYIIPAFITEKLPSIIEKKHQIQVSIESATFDPFKFTLSLHNISIKHDTKDALSSELLSIADTNLTLSPLSLIRTNFVCEKITFNKPNLNLIRYTDGSYNISKYIDTSENTSPSEILDFAELPFLFSLNNVSISNGQIQFQDKPSKKTHTVKQLSLSIPTLSNFSYETAQTITPHFSAIVNGSPLEISPQSPDASNNSGSASTENFTVELKNFNVPQYIEYLPFSLPLKITEGIGKGKIELSFPSKDRKEEKLTVKFKLQLDNITTSFDDESLITHIPSSQFLGTYHPVTNEFNFENVYIQEPAITLSEEFSKESFYSAFLKNTVESSTTRQQAPSAKVLIRKMLVDGGTLFTNTIKDSSLGANKWKEIRLSLNDYTNVSLDKKESKTRGSFRMSGAQQKASATFTWNGVIDSSGQPSGNLQIKNTPASTICNSLWQNAATCSTGTANLTGSLSIVSQKNSINKKAINFSLKDTEIEFKKVRFTEKDKVWLYAETSKISVKYFNHKNTDISKLSIVGANIHLHQYFVPKLILKFTEQGKTPLSIKNININGTLTVHNANNANPLIIEGFSLKSIDTGGKSTEQNLKIQGYTPDAGRITAKGTVQLSPLSCSFSTEFQNIASKQLLPLFSKNPIAINSKTNLSGKGVYSYPQSSFIGSLHTDSTELIGSNNLLTWNSATLSDISYKSQPFHIGIKKIDIQAPEFTWTREVDSTSPYEGLGLFFNELLPTNRFSKNRQKVKTPYYKIDQINVFQGEVSIKDNRFPNTSTQLITNIKGNFSDILAPLSSQEASFYFTGNSDNTPFSLSGKGDLLASPSNGKATYSFSNITPITILDELSKNTFYLKAFSTEGVVNSEWFDNQTINKVDVSVTGLLPQSPTSTEALALAFLYKEKQNFKLQYKQTVSPESQTTPLLTAGIENFKTRLIKSQISPILLAEEDYSDLISITSLPFQSGSATLTGKTMELLSRFSSLLTSYPLLAITLEGQLNFIEDKKTIFAKLFEAEQQRVEAENDRLFKLWQEETEKVSVKNENITITTSADEIIEGDITEPMVHQFTPLKPKPVSVPNSMLSALATQRVKAVYDFLVTDIGVPEVQLQIREFSLTDKKILKDHNVKISLTTLFPAKIQQNDIDSIFNNSYQ